MHNLCLTKIQIKSQRSSGIGINCARISNILFIKYKNNNISCSIYLISNYYSIRKLQQPLLKKPYHFLSKIVTVGNVVYV